MISESKKSIDKKITILDGVSINIESHLITANGPAGEVKKRLNHPKVKIDVKDNQVIISCNRISKREKKIVNTFLASIKNMIKGAKQGFVYKLKICSGHFPMSVNVQGNELIVKNFFGEKIPRKAKILPGIKVKIEGDVIIVEGADKEAVGATSSNIEQSTKRIGFDRRVFQDGIWLIEKGDKS